MRKQSELKAKPPQLQVKHQPISRAWRAQPRAVTAPAPPRRP